MDKDFYVIELYRQVGAWSGKANPYYRCGNGVTPNLELARKYATLETAQKNMTKRKYPFAKIRKVINGELEETK